MTPEIFLGLPGVSNSLNVWIRKILSSHLRKNFYLPEKVKLRIDMHDSIIPDFSTKAIHFKSLKVSSTAFLDHESIPSKYTCDGQDFNPPLDIDDIPLEAKCLALIMDDPDAPRGTWVHWVVWNIPITHHIRENEIQGDEGLNDSGKNQYNGPCPPSGTHRYFFKVYALDALLDLSSDTRKEQLENKMSKHIIAFGELVGLYTRNK